MLSDIEIAQQVKIHSIKSIAKKATIPLKYLEMYGLDKAKINLDIFNDFPKDKKGKLVLVTAINPTPAGEGKTTTTIGLGQALTKLGVNTMIALREPSMGPVFGLKGGATGGGYSQVLPMDDINLHFTGDMHAITCAVNLIAACIDNHIYQGNELNIDIDRITWHRALDMNDRSLRSITIGQGAHINGIERKDSFDITVASEIMAILCLSNNLMDFKKKVGNIIIAYSNNGKPIFIKDLKIEGAVAVVMKEAIKPNLVQSIERTPVLIHGGPFANIAHGCNSLIATKLAMSLSDITVTEAGFGADLGAEKFFDIKCRYGDIKPDMVVIVATIRALKMHGGVDKEDLGLPNLIALNKGIGNLEKHIENIKKFNLPYVIAINKFNTDTTKEIKILKQWCQDNTHPVYLCDVFAKGGKGALDLAVYINESLKKDTENKFEFLYDINDSIQNKINKIATIIYGASEVHYEPKALQDIQRLEKNNLDKLAICMAKTPSSLSDNPKLMGRPQGFTIKIKEIRLSNGAGLIIPIAGSILTMPGLPKNPAAEKIDINEKGKIRGLY